MDFTLGLATLALSGVLSFVATIGYAWAVAICLLGIFFAVHLHMAQPADDKSEVGVAPRLVAFAMAAPLFTACFGAMCWLFAGSQA